MDKVTPPQEQPVLFYTTWPDAETAATTGAELVDGRLSACVNILAPATAIYEWQGEVQHDTEYPMIIKTTIRHVEAVTALIKMRHPFDVPAIVVLPLAGGEPAYLGWINDQTKPLPASG